MRTVEMTVFFKNEGLWKHLRMVFVLAFYRKVTVRTDFDQLEKEWLMHKAGKEGKQ